MTLSAVEAALRAARQLALPSGAPEVLHDGSSVLVRLGTDGPVARVGGLTALVRDVSDHYEREVEIARWLHAAGAPVIAPWTPSGPVGVDGAVVSFWHPARTAKPAADGAQAGAALRRCHAALESFPGDLPGIEERFIEAEAILPRLPLDGDDRRRLEHALGWCRQLVATTPLPVQALHGDAGLGNVLSGGVWLDWEDTCRGPIVWDLACLVSTARITGRRALLAEAALAAYGDAPGREQLEAYVTARAVQVLPWSLLFAQRSSALPLSTRHRLAWLREHAPSR